MNQPVYFECECHEARNTLDELQFHQSHCIEHQRIVAQAAAMVTPFDFDRHQR